ncbi:MAG: response regulator [Gammaproteobacteria bacterium]|nr:response regulator [Gammaproteobacteria bacterium]
MKRVLLVDDSPLVVERVREAIGEIARLSVADAVHREHTAVEALEHGGIDIVVLDLHLDWGTGFGVLRALQGIDLPRPRVVVFTTYDLPEYRRQALALGADHFLDKARDFDKLIQILQGYAETEPGSATVQ